jgi:hypothetical protein
VGSLLFKAASLSVVDGAIDKFHMEAVVSFPASSFPTQSLMAHTSKMGRGPASSRHERKKSSACLQRAVTLPPHAFKSHFAPITYRTVVTFTPTLRLLYSTLTVLTTFASAAISPEVWALCLSEWIA